MKQIIDVEYLERNMRRVDTVSEYKQQVIERWVYRNFENIKLEHKKDYTLLIDKDGGQMKITYKAGKLELEY